MDYPSCVLPTYRAATVVNHAGFPKKVKVWAHVMKNNLNKSLCEISWSILDDLLQNKPQQKTRSHCFSELHQSSPCYVWMPCSRSLWLYIWKACCFDSIGKPRPTIRDAGFKFRHRLKQSLKNINFNQNEWHNSYRGIHSFLLPTQHFAPLPFISPKEKKNLILLLHPLPRTGKWDD